MNNYYYIVDSSYIIYYAANSAFSEYARDFDILESEMGPEFNPVLDSEYTYLFERKFLNCIQRPVQSIIPFIDSSRYIFCLDCKRKNIWRREIFPEYKIQRDTKDVSKDKFNIGKAFEYAYQKIIPGLCADWNANVIRCEYGEGDDCIAVTTKCILDNSKFNKVIIISCDKDMVQLYNERTSIITCDCTMREPKQELESAIKEKIQEDISAKDFLLWKIILGDKSDGIPNIKEGIGNKKAFKLLMDRDSLRKLITEDINIAKAFKRNRELISLENIPEGVQLLIKDEVNSLIFKDSSKNNDVDNL